MINLRSLVQITLKDIHPEVYYQLAPEDAVFPYLVYDITSVQSDGEGMSTVLLDIDGWDMPPDGDTTRLEEFMEAVNALNKRTLTTDKLVLTLYLERILSVVDDDKRIKRRKHIYEGRSFEGS